MIGLPHILATAGQTEGLESHRFECDVAGKDHQVSPGNFAAILLFDRPEQAPRLLEIGIVRPAVERRIALLTPTPAAASVASAIRACAVPCHSYEQRPIVAKVRRPPVL